MRPRVSARWAVALAAGLVVAAAARAQAPPAGKAAPAPRPKAAAPARPAEADEVLATVNNEPITRGEVVGILSRLDVPPDRQREAYDEAIDMLINTHLLTQFLREQKVTVAPKEID